MLNIITINKSTGWRGVASRRGDHYYVFEGASDGSDDRCIDSDTFRAEYLCKEINHEENVLDYEGLEKEYGYGN